MIYVLTFLGMLTLIGLAYLIGPLFYLRGLRNSDYNWLERMLYGVMGLLMLSCILILFGFSSYGMAKICMGLFQ